MSGIGLKDSMKDPNLVVESDELIVIIKDKYPKAKKHFLVLPKEDINTIYDIQEKHLLLLKHMHNKAEDLIAKAENADSEFRIGYHAFPSMRHLHLHVISQDFDSPFLKTLTEWKSFTTDYFVDSKNVIKQIEEDGCVQPMNPNVAKEILALSFRCPVCKADMKNIHKLKKHIKVHNKKKGINGLVINKCMCS